MYRHLIPKEGISGKRKGKPTLRSQYGEYGSSGWYRNKEGKKIAISNSRWTNKGEEFDMDDDTITYAMAEEMEQIREWWIGGMSGDDFDAWQDQEEQTQERNRAMYKQPEKPLFSEGDDEMRSGVRRQQYEEEYDDYYDDGWSRTSSRMSEMSYPEKDDLADQMGNMTLDPTHPMDRQIMGLPPLPFAYQSTSNISQALERISYDDASMRSVLEHHIHKHPEDRERMEGDILQRTSRMKDKDDDDEGEDIFLAKYIKETYGKSKKVGGSGYGPEGAGWMYSLKREPLEATKGPPIRQPIVNTPPERHSANIPNNDGVNIRMDWDNVLSKDKHLFTDSYVNSLGLPKSKSKGFGYDPNGVTRNAHRTAKKIKGKYTIGVDGSNQELQALKGYLEQGNSFNESWREHYENWNSMWKFLKNKPNQYSKNKKLVKMYDYLKDVLN